MYIFDRHCVCIYYQDWHRHRKNAGSGGGGSSSAFGTSTTTSMNGGHVDGDSGGSSSSPANSSSANHLTSHHSTTSQLTSLTSIYSEGRMINIEEESKLVYGVVFSLRNFVRKLSGR